MADRFDDLELTCGLYLVTSLRFDGVSNDSIFVTLGVSLGSTLEVIGDTVVAVVGTEDASSLTLFKTDCLRESSGLRNL